MFIVPFSFLHWNPAKELFILPIMGWPILWYGFFFGSGFFLGYLIFLRRIKGFFREKPYFTEEDLLQKKEILLLLKKHFAKDELGNATTVLAMLNHLLKQENLFQKLPFGKKGVLSLPLLVKNRELLDLFLSPYVLTLSKRSTRFVDKLLLYVVLGTIIGAKLGHFLFYENFFSYIKAPWELFQGRGFASHGAVVGVFLAGYVFIRKEKGISWKVLLDLMVLPSLFIAGSIRLGNFFNQEVLGTVTTVPWAIVFENPLNGSLPAPRHPAQLYEAFFYFFLFFLFSCFFKKRVFSGKTAGSLLCLLFSFRFLIEFFKEEQSLFFSGFLNMGQVLSVPFLLFGFWLWVFPKKKALS